MDLEARQILDGNSVSGNVSTFRGKKWSKGNPGRERNQGEPQMEAQQLHRDG